MKFIYPGHSNEDARKPKFIQSKHFTNYKWKHIIIPHIIPTKQNEINA